MSAQQASLKWRMTMSCVWRQDVATYSLMTEAVDKDAAIARAQHVLSQVPLCVQAAAKLLVRAAVPAPWGRSSLRVGAR